MICCPKKDRHRNIEDFVRLEFLFLGGRRSVLEGGMSSKTDEFPERQDGNDLNLPQLQHSMGPE